MAQENWKATGPEETDMVEKAKELRKEYLGRTTATEASSVEDALKLLDTPNLVTAPSGVTYAMKKLSPEGLSLFMAVIQEAVPGEDNREVGYKIIQHLSEYVPLIHEHIMTPKIPIEKLPGSDVQHLATYLMFEIAGVVDTPTKNFPEQ